MSSSLNDRDWEPAGSIHHDPKTARRNAKAEAAAAKARYKASRPWYKRPLTLLGAVLGALVAVVLLSQCGGDDSPGTTGSGSGAVVEQPAEQQLPAGQQNALDKGEQYLDALPFSRDGLAKQLESEGFSEADAAFAADNVDADWNEQAAAKAESYQDAGVALSYDGMVRQLETDGFTEQQADHGARSLGLTPAP